MKALEILDYFRSEQIANGCTPFLLEMYNEAIAELEALQQHKSCDGCKYCTKVFSYTYPLCIKDEQYPFQIHNKELLYCNRYEPKEQ